MAERDLLVTALVQEVLGPRGGAREVLKREEDPRDEYITGVLAPHDPKGAEPDPDADDDLLGGDDIRGDDQGDPGPAVASSAGLDPERLPSPSLDPRVRPASLGLSFSVAGERPEVELCCTWGRYHQAEDGKWHRKPVGEVRTIACDRDQEHSSLAGDPGITLHLRCTRLGEHWRVSVFLVNSTAFEPPPSTADHVFQPQIRVVCRSDTTLVPLDEQRAGREDDEERALAFLYREHRSMARGHLCSVTWQELDPERQVSPIPQPTTAPFAWEDGLALFDEEVVRRFSPPDLRTEYVPMMPVSAPDRSWPNDSSIPQLDPERLAETWDPEDIHRGLDPLARGYERWIQQQEKEAGGMAAEDQQIAGRHLQGCREALRRMREGIQLLVENPEARLAFCFANRAMALQSSWRKGRAYPWYPFQLAFQLVNLPGLADRTHPDRKICDLLWFSTGGGKTEAYLALTAFTLAFRRLQATRKGSKDGGAGVSVLSRYTLRLLTIQQFRRALALITACEFLRVQKTPLGQGWRPKVHSEKVDFLWGSTRFSAGLWVGGGVTPNQMHDLEYTDPRTKKFERVPGALSILRGKKGKGEPAQVLECPACQAILAVSPEGFQPGETKILHLVWQEAASASDPPTADELSRHSITVIERQVHIHPNPDFCTLSLKIRCEEEILPQTVDDWVRKHVRKSMGAENLVPARASRPGYFCRWHQWGKSQSEKPIDFEIFCPDPECVLNQGMDWEEQTPCGAWPGIGAFQTTGGKLTRCPIPAWTVDEQILHRCPSVVVATVDKFARLSFEPRAASLFGNVEAFNEHLGYYRRWCLPSVPTGTLPVRPQEHLPSGRNERVDRLAPPDLILQDELHLIEGPLGSMVGLYETAIDALTAHHEARIESRAKYLASTATVRNAESQVRSIQNRELAVFPPPGLQASDSFFSRTGPSHPLESTSPGRLYVGVCAPGRGAKWPVVQLWSRLLQHSAVRRQDGAPAEDLDPFWTLVGYFNAKRELAGAVALTRQDILQRLTTIGGGAARDLNSDEVMDLSSNADSMELPGMLEKLGHSLGQTGSPVPVVAATSMFGTGVDVDRLGLMVVHGQPKTTSSYIQATGRVGRQQGGLVVTLFRASRPRDLNHYEFFCAYHNSLHRFVEPVTVNPFAPRARDRALGPVAVALLRLASSLPGTEDPVPVDERWRAQQKLKGDWHCRAEEMATCRHDPEVEVLPAVFEARTQQQPLARRPIQDEVRAHVEEKLDRWQELAAAAGGSLLFSESTMVNPARSPVVLGDLAHQLARTGVAYEQAPNSLREVEATVTLKGWKGEDSGTQQIRPSQFITTYGPGSLIETPSGPVLASSLDRLFRHLGQDPADFEIADDRLSKGILERARIVRLPTNDELGLPVKAAIYPTQKFPYWALCTAHTPEQILYLRTDQGCPSCGKREQGGRDAIRFVLVCPAGHLDEVPWSAVVHQGTRSCNAKHFLWRGGGRALRHVTLECPKCGDRVNFGQAYARTWHCRGRRQEIGQTANPDGCNHSARIMQRGAANLHMPVVETALTVLDMSARLYQILGNREVLLLVQQLIRLKALDRDNFGQSLLDIDLSPVARDFLAQLPWEEIHTALQRLLGSGESTPIREEEFDSLRRAATHGAPPVPSSTPAAPPLFEVPKVGVREFPSLSENLRFRVAPITRLRIVMVQTGYQRDDPQTGDEVTVRFNWGDQEWYPGVELFGEGIFLVLVGASLSLEGKRAERWLQRYSNNPASPVSPPPLHPVHVWWHTLSHRLLRTLSLDSGYSSAAIRERVYFDFDSSGRPRGGLLLYTVQPGGDGTLGGLVALVDSFDRILAQALQDLDSCSNDPLCAESPQAGAPGAACYACLLASETSCEYHNHGLDRLLLLENYTSKSKTP